MSPAFVKETDADAPGNLPELPLSEHPDYVRPQESAQWRARQMAAEERLAAVDPDSGGARLERVVVGGEQSCLRS